MLRETNQEEYKSIENIKHQNLVKTMCGNFVPVKHILKSVLYSSKDNKDHRNIIYKLTREKYPELLEDLYITGGHSILVDELTPTQSFKSNVLKAK